ncbi:hypothetical protein BAE44_0023060, partial [Dichanthelium oligosanthes]
LFKSNIRDWDCSLLKLYFHAHDVDEIMKIRIPQHHTEDVLAWHYAKSGLFSVRSAYRLAHRLSLEEVGIGSTSSSNDGSRKIRDHIWSAPVPDNRWKRNLEVDSTCRLCGNGEENGFHAVVSCTKARALRMELRKDWPLIPKRIFAIYPSYGMLKQDGPDWLLLLLDKIDVDDRAQVLFLFWHSWHLRNDAIHGSGSVSVFGSACFVISYWNSLLNISHGRSVDIKGNQPLHQT